MPAAELAVLLAEAYRVIGELTSRNERMAAGNEELARQNEELAGRIGRLERLAAGGVPGLRGGPGPGRRSRRSAAIR